MLTLKFWCCCTVQKRQAAPLRRLAQQEGHGDKEPVEQECLLHAGVEAGAGETRLHCKHIHSATLHDT